jgi:hypothetical protein
VEEGIPASSLSECSKKISEKIFSLQPSEYARSGKPVNLGMKKFGDSPREPLKCWECGEPHLRRNCPCLISANRTVVHNLQEASMVGDVGRSLHRINAAIDGRQADHQSSVVEIEGKINNT